jgi:hypothetical protein
VRGVGAARGMLDYSVLPQCFVAAVVVYTACLVLHALLPLPKHSGYAPFHHQLANRAATLARQVLQMPRDR